MIKAIVTDIEGTTSSLSFVKDVLFPYARNNMANFIRDQKNSENIRRLMTDVCNEVNKDLSIDEIITQLITWIDSDKKITPLKTLQGLLWETGYKNGDFKGHIYLDAKNKLENWHKQNIRLFVYSSGSVYAQKLLFAYTEYGDLNDLFEGNFDTKIGQKFEVNSYQKISKQIGIDADKILFLSDIQKELDAAQLAGMRTYWLIREGEIDPTATHKQVMNFDEITLT